MESETLHKEKMRSPPTLTKPNSREGKKEGRRKGKQ
jgi:hypothetical protein